MRLVVTAFRSSLRCRSANLPFATATRRRRARHKTSRRAAVDVADRPPDLPARGARGDHVHAQLAVMRSPAGSAVIGWREAAPADRRSAPLSLDCSSVAISESGTAGVDACTVRGTIRSHGALVRWTRPITPGRNSRSPTGNVGCSGGVTADKGSAVFGFFADRSPAGSAQIEPQTRAFVSIGQYGVACARHWKGDSTDPERSGP
jgi:hypothetical protein